MNTMVGVFTDIMTRMDVIKTIDYAYKVQQ